MAKSKLVQVNGKTVEEARQRMSSQHPAPDREPADTDKP